MPTTYATKPEEKKKSRLSAESGPESPAFAESDLGVSVGLPLFLQGAPISSTGQIQDEKEEALQGQTIQAKLIIGAPNDPSEQEADRVAEQVVQMKAVPCYCGGTCSECSKKNGSIQQKREQQSNTSGASVSDSFLHNLGPGQPLDSATRAFFESRFGHDLSHVRIFTDPAASQSARSINAKAYTLGSNIVFNDREYRPDSKSGRHLIAHELAHTIQHSKHQTQKISRQARPEAEDQIGDPVASWQRANSSALLMVFADDQLFLLPSAPLVRVADAESQRLMAESRGHLTFDLGALMEVPPVGAGGTRVFRAGSRTALIVDAGSDPAGRIPAAVYLNEFQGVMASLGVTSVSEIRCIHVHQDHVSEISTIVANSDVRGGRVSIPRSFLGTNASIRRVVADLTNTTDANLVGRGFGSGWVPVNPVLGHGSGGDVFRFGYNLGELRVEAIALRSALETPGANPDLDSFLTKVTRPADRASVVVVGDLRGRHLETIRTAMEVNRPGSWNEFFSGVTNISGFSHHAGRLEERDITGIMALLDSTLLLQGRLRVVEQTTTTRHSRARTDTLELLSQMGVEVGVAELPGSAATSGVGVSRSGLYARGPSASVRAPVSSPLLDAWARIERIRASRATIETWRPWLEETGGANARTDIETILTELDISLTTLVQSARLATEAALRIRTGGATTTGGGRDYSAGGGTRGAAFATALSGIPATTAGETRLDPEGFRYLEQLRALPESEIPMRVLLYAALVRGEYSDRAFALMLAALEPDTRTRLLTRRRGDPLPAGLVAFDRVRAEYGFRQSVYAGDTFAIPRNWSSGGRMAAGTLVWLQLALEIWNNIVYPLMQAHEMSTHTFRGRNMIPFLRRFMFWQQANVHPRIVGVNDTLTGGIVEEREFDRVISQLETEQLTSFYFEEPVISDTDVMRFGAWLAYNVRNFDEFSVLFIDSGQDAIRWQTPGSMSWNRATWQVRAGRYETSGENHVEERWVDHPLLTRLMNTYVERIINNTASLIEKLRTSADVSPESEAELGRLETASGIGRPIYETTLRNPSTTTSQVEIQPFGVMGWNSVRPPRLSREITWWSPPRFFVYEVSGGWVRVSGADYNTYAVLRRLLSERHTIVANTRSITDDEVTTTGNLYGLAWIREDQLTPRPGPTVPSVPSFLADPVDSRSTSPGPRRGSSPIRIEPFGISPTDDRSGPGSPGGSITIRF